MDEAVAWYLYQHVQDGYLFLMQNYKVGDKIHIFGAFRTFPEDGDLIDLLRYLRLFSGCVYRPGPSRNVAQGKINLTSHYSHWVDRTAIPDWPTPEGQRRASTFCIQTFQGLKE
jgi:hypothetical protein